MELPFSGRAANWSVMDISQTLLNLNTLARLVHVGLFLPDNELRQWNLQKHYAEKFVGLGKYKRNTVVLM